MRTRRGAAGRAAALLLGLAGAAAPSRAADVVERVLAVVDGRPVLLSEVRVRQRLQGTTEAEALEGLLDELLMYEQAARLPQAALRPDEEERALADARGKLPGATRADEGNLRRLARRQATILKYVEFRFRPQARVTDEEVRAAFEREVAGRAVYVGINRIAQMNEEVRMLRPNGAHDRKRFVGFAGITAEAESHFGVVIGARRGNKTSNRSRPLTGNEGAVVIAR